MALAGSTVRHASPAFQRFVLLVMLPTVLMMLPFWFFEIDPLLISVITPIFMFLPSLAALIVLQTVVRPPSRRAYLAMTPLRPLRTTAVGALALLGGTVAVVVATLLLSHLGGFIRLDLTTWSGFRGSDPSMSASAAQQQVVLTLAILPLYIAIYLVPTTGEELGWRGFLHTLLRPLGFWPAALRIAAVWVIWHIPLIATSVYLGEIPVRQAAATLGNLAVVSLVFSALRERSGSVWPAALGHAMLNTVVLFGLSAFHSPIAANDHIGFWGFTIINWLCWLAALAVILRRPPR